MSLKAKLLVTKNRSQQPWEECRTLVLGKKAVEAVFLQNKYGIRGSM